MMPLVSVVIPTHNRSALLRDALESVAAQTFTNFEIIVVDDGSTDRPAEAVCAEFEQCRYIYQDWAGRSAARNRGINASSSEFVAFLDDDDRWKPEKLAVQVAYLNNHPEVGLVHCATEVIDAAGIPTGRVTGNESVGRQGWVFDLAMERCFVKSPTPMLRRKVIERAGFFNETMHQAEDWEYWARVAFYCRFGHITEALAEYRVHERSTTLFSGTFSHIDEINRSLLSALDPSAHQRIHRTMALLYRRDMRYQTSRLSPRRIYWYQRILRSRLASILP